MGTALSNKTIAFLTASEGAEQGEMLQPWQAAVAEGGHPVLICPEPGETR